MSDSFPPPPIESPAAWRGDALFDRPDWQVRFGAEDNEELRTAVRATRGLGLDELGPEVLSVSRLSTKLLSIRDSLERGTGATMIRGLEIGEFDRDGLARLFFAIACQIGTPVSQSAEGERLLCVRDQGFERGDPRVRGPHTNKRLSFHTDRCDVIGFLCVRPAVSGGQNHLISSVTLYNELVRRYPEQLRILGQPFPYLRHTVDGGNERRYTNVPVFAIHEGQFAASFLRVLIDRADSEPGVPGLSDAQRAALDTLESVAEDPELYASFRLESGDVLLLNNWVTFHRRTAFEDHPDPGLRRELLRVWLSVPNSRPLDPRFADHFGSTEAGALRGGMRTSTS